MTSSKKLLIITASNGENLKLANRFLKSCEGKQINSTIMDLTTLDLPLYNPRTHAEKGIPNSISEINAKISAFPRWIICAPEYNGSIPPILTNLIAWLSVQGEDFRILFNGRPIAMASFSGGGGMELLLSLRIQLTHLGAQVVGRQLMSNHQKIAKDEAISDLIDRLMQMNRLKL